MDKVECRPTMVQDIFTVARTMRQADVAEILAHGESSPTEALFESVDKTPEPITATYEDIPIAIFGVSPKSLISDIGIPWLLGSEELVKHTSGFTVWTSKVLAIWLEQYRILENYVHVENKVSIRWLKKMGFTIEEPIKLPNTGEYFSRFWMERDHV